MGLHQSVPSQQTSGYEKPIVFSIHGIRSEGHWQAELEAKLSPFFEYRQIKYPYYKNEVFGVLRLTAGHCAALLLAPLSLLIVLRLKPTQASISAALACIPVIAVAFVYEFWERKNAVRKVYGDICVKAGSTPSSIIAHSLGTYLVCSALENYPELRFDTLIFHGCVVSRSYPWRQVFGGFQRVHNEVAKSDLVAHMAALLGLTVRGMGSAGANGFRGDAVHEDQLAPRLQHQRCTGNECCEDHVPTTTLCPSVVHNIRFPGGHSFNHPDPLLKGFPHAKFFWLPWLFGLDPTLFHDFIDLCGVAARTPAPGIGDKIFRMTSKDAEQKLSETCWGWTGGPLQVYAQDQLVALSAAMPEIRDNPLSQVEVTLATKLSIQVMSKMVSRAAMEIEKISNRDEAATQNFHPVIAVHKVIGLVLKRKAESMISQK